MTWPVSSSSASPSASPLSPPSQPPPPLQRRRNDGSARDQHTLLISSTLYFLAIFSSALAAIPRLRLIESKVCLSYYSSHVGDINRNNNVMISDQFTTANEISEMRCKASQIQAELSSLLGWNHLIGNIPSLLLATFYSLLAETISRRTLLLVNVISGILGSSCLLLIVYASETLSSIKWIWAANFFDCIGGGALVFNTLVQILIAKSVPGSDLSKILFNLTAILTLSRMIGVSLSAYLMESTPWLPLSMALILSALRILPILLLDDLPVADSLMNSNQHEHWRQRKGDHLYHVSENLQPKSDPNFDSWQAYEDITTKHSNTPSHILHLRSKTTTRSIRNRTLTKIYHLRTILICLPSAYLRTLHDLYQVMKSNSLVLVTFFVHESAMGVRNIAEQWTSTRYSIPLSKVTYILALETLASAGILALIPVTIRYFCTDTLLKFTSDRHCPTNSSAKTASMSAEPMIRTPHGLEPLRATPDTDAAATSATNFHKSERKARFDPHIARLSLVFASIGAVLVGLSPSLAFLIPSLLFFALGIGFHDALKAYATNVIMNRFSSPDTKQCVSSYDDIAARSATLSRAGTDMEMVVIGDASYADKEEEISEEADACEEGENEEKHLEVSRFYMCLSVLEIIANMFSGPVWAQIYAAAIDMKDSSMDYLVGIPFWVSAIGFCAAFMTFGLVSRRERVIS